MNGYVAGRQTCYVTMVIVIGYRVQGARPWRVVILVLARAGCGCNLGARDAARPSLAVSPLVLRPISILPRAALAAALTLGVSCSDATGPGRVNVLFLGVTVSGRVDAVDRPIEYKLVVKKGDEFVVYFQSFTRGLVLTIVDPATDQVIGQAQAFNPAGQLTDVRTQAMHVQADNVLLLRVAAQPETDFGEFRLRAEIVPRAPEGRTAEIAVNDTIRESLSSDIDVDEFTFDASANEEVIVFLNVAVPTPLSTLKLQIADPTGKELVAFGISIPSDDLEATSSGRMTLSEPGRYRIRIEQWGRVAPLPYTFQVRRITRQPERVPITLPVNDTVDTEVFDYVGDIDEFVVKGNAGDLVNVFVQTLDTARYAVRAEIVDQANTLIELNPADPLTLGGIGTRALPAAGQMTVRVSGTYRGRYRLLAYRIDPGPEHGAATLAPGVTASERIELPGDIDRFTLTLAQAGSVNLVLRKPTSSPSTAFQLHLRRAGELAEIGYASAPQAYPYNEIGGSTGNRQLEAGSYVVEIDGYASRKGGYTGPYELMAFQINPAPEHRSAAFAIGDTIVGESIDHIGDVDVFTFSGTAGQSVYAYLQEQPGTYPGIGAEIVHPTRGALIQLPEHYSGPIPAMRVELPETGTYQLRITQADTKTKDANPYRAGIIVANRGPESVPAAIGINALVTDERTDYRGDIDEFTVSGTPGQEMTARFGSRAEFGIFVGMTAVDPESGTVIAGADWLIDGQTDYTGRFKIPSSGHVVLRVAERPRCDGVNYCYNVAGPFDLQTRSISRAPESVSARTTVGDTITGEAVAFPGELDEFLFAGTAGQRVHVVATAGIPGYGEGALIVELIDPATSTILAWTTARWGEGATDIVTLPASRDFMIRVRGARDNSDAASYTLVLESP